MIQQTHLTTRPRSGQFCLPSDRPVFSLSEAAAVDPRILDALVEANTIQHANWITYSVCKASLSRIVGPHARDKRLRSPVTHAAVMARLLEVLGL